MEMYVISMVLTSHIIGSSGSGDSKYSVEYGDYIGCYDQGCLQFHLSVSLLSDIIVTPGSCTEACKENGFPLADVRELKEEGVSNVVRSTQDRRWSKGLVILGVTGAVVGGLYAVATPFLLPAFRRVCLPYVPATTAQVDNVFSVLKRAASATSTNQTLNAVRGTGVKQILADLGSGDGRIVIEGAKQGYHGVGYELNPWLVWYSRLASRQAGMKQRTSFHRTNLWNVDLSKFDVIVIFGVSQMMAALESKISSEMKPSALVVACRFPIPDWEPHLCEGTGVDEVWLYRASSKNVTDVRTEVSSSELS